MAKGKLMINTVKNWIKGIIAFVALIFAIWFVKSLVGYNSNQKYQILQSIGGQVTIQSDGGYYTKFFPSVWSYPKQGAVFFSNNKAESPDKDAITFLFSNKGVGTVNCQVLFRLYTDKERMLNLHQLTGGDIEIVYNIILSELKTAIGVEGSKYTSSKAIEDREGFANKLTTLIVGNKKLQDLGIEITSFTVNDITFDTLTTELFKAQQTADLNKITAIADQENLTQQKLKTEALYANKIAEAKGKAEEQKITATTNAEREKQIAVIEAEKKVKTAELAKQEAEIEQSKILSVADFQRQQAEVKLKTEELVAKQVIVAAQAQEEKIKIAGAMKESDKIRLEIAMQTEIGVAEAWSKGIAQMKLPVYMTIGTGGTVSGNGSSLEGLLQLLTVKTAKEVVEPVK